MGTKYGPAATGTSKRGVDNIFTAKEVREIWSNCYCGNCKKTDTNTLAWDKGCEQLLCAECRYKKFQVLRSLAVTVRFERRMGHTHRFVPGTHFPAEYRND